ncbi:hypothetical protein BDP81DRAFT_422018 [Colletotrichum phormii]|uniref:Uncharacterized protein n=1 Tax=Colletotrichum phormii TaxID=359342 RepID=A0AAJ0EKG5_9PEZI|nr:uncharacterized protein BDP81DRAFT_422018 [Colletotrichum phormii]KAK1639895.1 hypothetical protein BDP81DRAFT_422018 [Colletotrichum phormii]
MGSGLSSVSNSYPSCTYRQTLNEQGKVRCRVGDTNHDSSWGRAQGRSRTRQPEQASLVLRVVTALGCVNDVWSTKCHCRRRCRRSSSFSVLLPSCSLSPLLRTKLSSVCPQRSSLVCTWHCPSRGLPWREPLVARRHGWVWTRM